MTKKIEIQTDAIRYGENGLVPVVVQDYESGEVIALCYMNAEAVQKTLEKQVAYYYNLEKGEITTFGNKSVGQKVMAMFMDEKQSSLLVKVVQKSAAGADGKTFSRFSAQMLGSYNAIGGEMFGRLQRLIEANKVNPEEGSYTSFLLARGVDKIAKKVGEEAVELVIAAKNDDTEEVVDEAGDFLYHMMVLLAAKDVKLSSVCAELCKRNR